MKMIGNSVPKIGDSVLIIADGPFLDRPHCGLKGMVGTIVDYAGESIFPPHFNRWKVRFAQYPDCKPWGISEQRLKVLPPNDEEENDNGIVETSISD